MFIHNISWFTDLPHQKKPITKQNKNHHLTKKHHARPSRQFPPTFRSCLETSVCETARILPDFHGHSDTGEVSQEPLFSSSSSPSSDRLRNLLPTSKGQLPCSPSVILAHGGACSSSGREGTKVLGGENRNKLHPTAANQITLEWGGGGGCWGEGGGLLGEGGREAGMEGSLHEETEPKGPPSDPCMEFCPHPRPAASSPPRTALARQRQQQPPAPTTAAAAVPHTPPHSHPPPSASPCAHWLAPGKGAGPASSRCLSLVAGRSQPRGWLVSEVLLRRDASAGSREKSPGTRSHLGRAEDETEPGNGRVVAYDIRAAFF